MDVYLHHGGKFVGEPIVGYEGGDTFDLAINNFESDLDARYLISVLQDQTELHLYYEHAQVDYPLELNEEEIRELERVEAERKEQEAELKRKHEEIERMEQEAAEKRRHEEEMEKMKPEVRDENEEYDDMEFEQSTHPGLQEMESSNASVEASQVRTRKKSVAVKKRKQKEKDDHADAIHASPASPPATVGDDAEEIPMNGRLSDGYESEDLESLDRDSDERQDKFPMYSADANQNLEITIEMKFENLKVFKMAVRNMNIAMGREVDFMKNDKARVMAYCVEKKGEDDC
ncbi:hypothetical protein CRG98_042522 [Punica granatum]|uniref:Uncharacterized protein n=1 Tax=Punica granatum TaxID=22663 RepID=A0A2I0HZG5_PUNGR|nr:hypothetical protein CRG98_042522 [Punica granatum]